MPYTRPTTDVAKEGLFNTLQHRMDFEGIKTLDLLAEPVVSAMSLPAVVQAT
ncbi:RsmD family RNA methyltransferase [Niabella sp. W65]|nr:RsmD family RNA methyltransferase [Niabella sp. W65]MCH7365895.1 RsmD family RNA methyltransferase [Niabella sp. W65]ULT41647.1 RsmD family RNA methyltransferase [Niabella sp. I65]